MECSWISPAALPGTTRLYSTFLSDFSGVSDFYSHPPTTKGIDDAAREMRLEDSVRRAVVEVLRDQNRIFGGDDATTRNLDRLRDGAFTAWSQGSKLDCLEAQPTRAFTRRSPQFTRRANCPSGA